MLKIIASSMAGALLCYAVLVAVSHDPMGPLVVSHAGSDGQRIFRGPMWHSDARAKYILAEYSALHCESIGMTEIAIEIKSRTILPDLLPPQVRLTCAPAGE
nr:hypothetical protein [uncultured Celeribacter sp.]